MRFDDRVALVTGAAKGIGLGIARRLLDEGVRVTIADKDTQALDKARAELGANWRCAGVAADLSQRDGAETAVSETVSAFGKIDILVNNAGGGVVRPTLSHTEQTLRRTIDHNLWTTIYVTLAALPRMVERSYGRIVNVGAESVRNGLYDHAIYNAAKGGVHGLTTGIAREFADGGITVNTVAPSMTASEQLAPLLELLETGDDIETAVRKQPALRHLADTLGGADALNAFASLFERILNTIPAKRCATVDEVASMVAYLACDEAGYVTGQVISVNGGSSML